MREAMWRRRNEEGLAEQSGLLYGKDIPEWIGLKKRVAVLGQRKKGQKTGFYLDQKENRFS